jgi:hypothetical protein
MVADCQAAEGMAMATCAIGIAAVLLLGMPLLMYIVSDVR